MPDLYRIQHTIQGASGLPSDRYVNTFYVDDQSTGDPDIEGWVGAINTFYEGAASPSPNPINFYYSGETANVQWSNKVYNMALPAPRQIIYEESHLVTTPPSDSALPTEVALCLSYRLRYPLSGVNLARQRGRIYLGPFGTNALASSGRPNPIVPTTILNAANKLYYDMLDLDANWALYSPTRNPGLSGGAIGVISVDNSWDTQRRRGLEPDARTTRILGTP